MAKFRVEFYEREPDEVECDFWSLFAGDTIGFLNGDPSDLALEPAKVKTVALFHWSDVRSVGRVPGPPQSES